jgi:hypothetical protein
VGEERRQAAAKKRQTDQSTTRLLSSTFHVAPSRNMTLRQELTLLWPEIEHWQRDNPAILSGYRRESHSLWTSISRHVSMSIAFDR